MVLVREGEGEGEDEDRSQTKQLLPPNSLPVAAAVVMKDNVNFQHNMSFREMTGGSERESQ